MHSGVDEDADDENEGDHDEGHDAAIHVLGLLVDETAATPLRMSVSCRSGADVTTFPDDTSLISERLILSPLRPEDAEEMVDVLADETLHEYIDGHPLTFDELRARYRELAAGSSRPDEIWLNWIVRRRSDARAVGTVQATITGDDAMRTAFVAWVIGVSWQRNGYASEAAFSRAFKRATGLSPSAWRTARQA